MAMVLGWAYGMHVLARKKNSSHTWFATCYLLKVIPNTLFLMKSTCHCVMESPLFNFLLIFISKKKLLYFISDNKSKKAGICKLLLP